MRRLVAAAVLASLVLSLGCRQTGEGEFEVDRPVIGTTTDTVLTPTIELGTDTATVRVPDIDVTPPGERQNP